MENKIDEFHDIDLKLFENISNNLASLRNSPDGNSKTDILIDQVIKINSTLKEVFGFSASSTETHKGAVAIFQEHQEILGMLTEKVQDLYGLINGLSGTSASAMTDLNQSGVNLQEVSSIVDLHSTHLDYHDQHLEAHDKQLETLTQLIQMYNR